MSKGGKGRPVKNSILAILHTSTCDITESGKKDLPHLLNYE